MNKCEMLHETIVRDIVDVINNVKDLDDVEWVNRTGRVGSIARQASNLVLVFPVLVTNSINISTATLIAKAIERKCVSLLQILFASINITEEDNLYDFISQFHSNLNARLTLDDFIKFADGLVEAGYVEVVDQKAYDAVKEDMHNINYYLDTSFNETSINDYISKTNQFGDNYIMLEDRRGSSPSNDLKNEVEYFKNQLLPQDVQKANELQPTNVAVNFTTYRDGIKNCSTGIVGIKAKLYPVDSMEIISRVSSKYKDSNTLFNLVRASTREISFFRDLAFAIDKAKLDAISMAKESNNAKMFKLLERRAAKNKFSALLKKNDASPITSLIISQEEVEYLKKYNNIDMEKSYVTRSILESYNLMDIVIADESLEVAKFLFDDGDYVYDVLPFDSLEKEAKDSSYKKVINLMSRISR